MANPQQVIVGEADPLDAWVDDILGETSEPAPSKPTEELEASNDIDEGEETEVSEEIEEEGEPEYVEIRHNGKPIKLKLEEVIEHAQKGFDYSHKTQELAEQRKMVEQYAQSIQKQAEFQSQFQQDFAVLASMDSQLQQYSAVNWDAWMDSDPVEASKGWQKFQMLRQNREEAVQGLQSRQSQAQQEMLRVAEMRKREGIAELTRDLGKDWNPDTRTALLAHGKNAYGFTDEELDSIQDPRIVKVLYDAYKYRALRERQPQVEKKVANAPKLAKPGQKPQASADVQAKQLMKMLKTSKSKTDREKAAFGLLDRFVS